MKIQDEIREKDPFLRELLEKMFEAVGADYESFDFTAPEWYRKYSWTEEQEAAFSEWATKQIMKNKKLPKKAAESKMAFWLLNYGWPIK